MNKNELRRQLKQIRAELTERDRLEAAAKIHEKILQECSPFSLVSCYVSFQSEVSTLELLPKLLKKHRVAVPCVVSKTHMEFVEIHPHTIWKRSSYGILEPVTGKRIASAQIDCFLIPLLGFDASCHRLGYGGGYYDRALVNSHAHKIALAFDEQEVAQVPIGSWDKTMDKIITPTRIIMQSKEL